MVEGIHSGLGGPASLTVSPDGRFVYVASRADAAVATFAREPNGSLSFRGCLTGGITAFVAGFKSVCTLVAPENSHGSGLRGVSRIVISPDGTSLYASSPKTSSLAEFSRDQTSGQLVYRGCISGESRGLGPGNPCRPIPSAQEAGFDSGMWLIDRLAIGHDRLYGVARGDDAVADFARDPATGALTWIGATATLDEPTDLAIGPGGLYVGARGDSAIALYEHRDPPLGLSLSACITSRRSVARPAGPCKLAQGRGGAHQLGFNGLSSLATAGGDLYAAPTRQSAISRFGTSGN